MNISCLHFAAADGGAAAPPPLPPSWRSICARDECNGRKIAYCLKPRNLPGRKKARVGDAARLSRRDESLSSPIVVPLHTRPPTGPSLVFSGHSVPRSLSCSGARRELQRDCSRITSAITGRRGRADTTVSFRVFGCVPSCFVYEMKLIIGRHCLAPFPRLARSGRSGVKNTGDAALND